MPLSYDYHYYTNKRILEAEDRVLDMFQDGKQHSIGEILEVSGECKRTVERIIASIRSYPGFVIHMSKKSGETRYWLEYNKVNDPYAQIGVAYANQV